MSVRSSVLTLEWACAHLSRSQRGIGVFAQQQQQQPGAVTQRQPSSWSTTPENEQLSLPELQGTPPRGTEKHLHGPSGESLDYPAAEMVR